MIVCRHSLNSAKTQEIRCYSAWAELMLSSSLGGYGCGLHGCSFLKQLEFSGEGSAGCENQEVVRIWAFGRVKVLLKFYSVRV